MQAEANKLLKDRVNLLATYGPERSTADKQRAYLLDLSMKFHIVASQALTNSMFLEQDSNEEKDTPRLGGLVRERMEIFKKDMKSHGLRYEFEPYQPLSPGDNVHVLSRKEEDITDLCGTFDGIQQTQEKVAKPIRHKIIPWIERRYLILRGIEIDTFHPSLLSDTMRTQSSNWNQLGLGYVSDVITIVHRFLLLILRIICPDEQTALNLMDALADNLAASYAAAMEQARLILSIETNTLTTLNDDLDSTLYQHRRFDDLPHAMVFTNQILRPAM